jgi:hypothetical protein
VFLYSDVKKVICGINNIKHACHKKVTGDRNILFAFLIQGKSYVRITKSLLVTKIMFTSVVLNFEQD